MAEYIHTGIKLLYLVKYFDLLTHCP